MKSLIIIARLLDYPDNDLRDNKEDVLQAMTQYPELNAKHIEKMAAFIHHICEQPLLNVQADHSELFDRGRAVSLLLFEHVHGESRDRGQAMIDLLSQYREAGVDLSTKELPDYLPAYLEYLSILSPEQATEGLHNVAHILALLKARLSHRGSQYAEIFDVLVDLSDSQISQQVLDEKVAQEAKDYTPEALDAVWEEEQITFSGKDSCVSEQQSQHQKRFAHSVTPQYLNIDALKGTQQ